MLARVPQDKVTMLVVIVRCLRESCITESSLVRIGDGSNNSKIIV